jgi:uncharacterized protein (DUF362 family)
MPSAVVLSYCEGRDAATLREPAAALLRSLIGGGSTDNPLMDVISPGQEVVIKPNMVRHFNPVDSLEAVVTSPELCRVLVELAGEAVGPNGRVVVADSPQNDCDWGELLEQSGWNIALDGARRNLKCEIELRDLRPETVVMKDGVIVERAPLPGDPIGTKVFDLGEASAFTGSGLDPKRLRGSDYDPEVTRSSHSDGSHAYSICRTFLDADVLIVVPKVKTHKKVGLSLAMKNCVGLVGEKNRLPHHTAGFAGAGGDEYPAPTAWPKVRQWAVERARPLLAKGKAVPFFRAMRRMEAAFMPEIAERSGNWWGNDTAWRMVVDLVTILKQGRAEDNKLTLFVYDGLVCGEGEGPLAPRALDVGLLAASDDPVAGDWTVASEMGFDPELISLFHQARDRNIWGADSWPPDVRRISDPPASARPLTPHPGWMRTPVAS